MPKNGSITSFFKPMQRPSQGSPPDSSPQPQSQPPTIRSRTPPQPQSAPRRSSSPPTPQHLPSDGTFSPNKEPGTPGLPSLPQTPSALRFLDSSPIKSPTPKPRAQDAVIKASDDEGSDEDSEDEFPDLLPARPTPSASGVKRESNVFSTPRANRAALDIYSSPLTINTKRIKYDINTLLKHAAAADAIEESHQRMNALLDQPSPSRESSPSAGKEHKSLHESIMEIMSEHEDSGDEAKAKQEKLLRAVKRTEADAGKKRWYFFADQNEPNSTSIEVRQPFPKASAKGAWGFLAAANARSHFFEDGFAHHLQKLRLDLPDEIFMWVLGETVHEKSWKLREAYLKLLSVCPAQAGRVMDEEVIRQFLRELGASEEALAASASLPSGKEQHNNETRPDYLERNWTSAETALRVLALTAQGMGIEALSFTMSIILRLGIDDLVHEDPGVSTCYQDVLENIVQAVPQTFWNDFCGEVAASLAKHTQEASLRWNAISSIPMLSSKLAELRRRLSLVFVFGEPQFARMRPEDTFSMQSVIQLINESPDFLIDRNNTDFNELRAMYDMLSVAVADGVKPPPGAGPAAIKQYDSEVDQTARRLKIMWSGIHEGGAAFESRLEAKAQLKDFERKLLHVVRTKPPRKDNIFGIDDEALVKRIKEEQQQVASKNFMAKFLGNEQPAGTTSTTITLD